MPLTDSPARDLNWLCFRENFVSPQEIETNKIAACAFVRDYIAANGEVAFVELLKQSGDPTDVGNFNSALSGWYEAHELHYTPSEVLYSIGGEHHDYLVRHRQAECMYMTKAWKDNWMVELGVDDGFLHGSYETIKETFEMTLTQMEDLQAALNSGSTYSPVTVVFMDHKETSYCLPARAELFIGGLPDFSHEYTHYLNTRFFREGHSYEAQIWLDEGLTEYLSITTPDPYAKAFYDYSRENGFRVIWSEEGDWNEIYKAIVADKTDVLDLWRVRWDLYPYYREDYNISDCGFISFTAYLIDTLGYETMYHYAYETGEERPQLDLRQLRVGWENYLEETYGEYPKLSDFQP